MRKKRIVAYREERIKKIAFNLRQLLRDVVIDYDSYLGGLNSNSWLQDDKEKSYLIQQQRGHLMSALRKSICMCPRCRKSDRDMIFNLGLKEWWCMQCYREMRDCYYEQKSLFSEEGEEEYYKTFVF